MYLDMTWIESTREWRIEEEALETEKVVWPLRDNAEEMTWKWEAKSLVSNPAEFLAKTNRAGQDEYIREVTDEGRNFAYNVVG